MNEKQVIAVDLGGTNVRVGIVNSSGIIKMHVEKVNASGTPGQVIDQICRIIDRLGTAGIHGIGMGVPGPVDEENGIVYEMINIPAWKKENVKDIFGARYSLPLHVQNDANCFALAEKYYGYGRNVHSFIGLIVGTGMAGGIVLNDRLYHGPNGMAGEFGMMGYLDHYYEYYCSGQFFENVYNMPARTVADKATLGDPDAISMWKEFGVHLSRAIEAIMYAYDPEMIILGGSVSKSLPLFEKWIWKGLENFVFKNSLRNFRLKASELEHPGILGAAALLFRD